MHRVILGVKRLEFDRFLVFQPYSWIDRFRCLVLMSPSAASYREMALANIGFCFSQIGDGTNARHYYNECLRRFPESGVAMAALRMIDSSKPGQQATTAV